MPRPALTDEQRRAIRRKIREAAARLYADDGINKISVRAIAERAGVSVGTVYSHFGSLSELLQSLWRQPARRMVQQMIEETRELDDPVAQLRALLSRYARFAIEEPQVFRSAFLFVRPEAIEPPARVALADDDFFQLFRSAVGRGQQAGTFRDGDCDRLTQMVISAVHGALALPINWHRLALDTTPEVVDATISAQLDWLQSAAAPS